MINNIFWKRSSLTIGQTDRQTDVLFFQYTGAPVAPAYIEQIYGADLLKPPSTNYMNISVQLRACE